MSERPIDKASVQKAAENFLDPETGRSVVETGQLQDISLDGGQLSVTLALTSYSAPLWAETRTALRDLLAAAFPDVRGVEVKPAVHERPAEPVGEVGLAAKSILAVGSGKGGVGKSTIAAAIAFGLHRAGCRVGLMDADVYGPSIPHLLGVSGRPDIDQNTRKIIPKVKDGLPVMSIGLLVDPDEAVIWRGPMLHGAVTQFLRDTDWGSLDYLVVDMPPGTGDVALTLSQLLQRAGAVVVCTPQDVALLDAMKAIAMFRKVNIPVLGMVENMSGFVCPDCGQKHDIFGSGGARRRAEELAVPFLGEIPLNMHIREQGDASQADAMFADPAVGPYLERVCHQLVKHLAEQHQAEPPLPSLNVL
jgi:ATP-binding protein involved in chromosome partitioning